MKRTLRLAAAALAAVALAMLGTAVPTANAASPGPAAPNPALINPTATVQLDIHKYLGTDTGLPNNGTVQSVSLPPLSGVDFDVYQVFYAGAGGTCPSTSKVDLTTNAGWTAAAAVTGYTPTQTEIGNLTFAIPGDGTYCLTKQATVTTTGPTGTAIFNKPDGVGLYLVNENLTTSGTITNMTTNTVVPNSAVSPAAPFFVTLPMTNPSGPQTGALTTWMYEVNVYPKNQSDSVTKTVVDKGTQTSEATGDGATHAITYTITSSITDGMTGTQMGEYVITDTLDTRLTLAAVNPVSLVLHKAGSTDITLTEGVDYTVSGTTTVVITFLADPDHSDSVYIGLDKLAHYSDYDVVTTIDANLTGTIGDGTIENTAYVIPNKAWDDTHTTDGVPSEPVTSEYGAITVLKYAAGDTVNKTGLPGAKFAIYKADSNGECKTANMVSTNLLYPEQLVGSDGTVTFDGLQVSTYYNGLPSQTAIQYCLVETQAPTNYNLLAEPIAFTVDAAGHNTVVDVSVPDQLKNLGNQLPLTGGQGVAVLSIGGVLLVGVGLLYYLVYSRRHRNAE